MTPEELRDLPFGEIADARPRWNNAALADQLRAIGPGGSLWIRRA